MFGRINRKGKSNTRSNTQSVVAWSLDFDTVLEDPDGLKVFTEFLKGEISSENIRFWLACQQYNQLTDPIEITKVAKDICDTYLRPCAADAVNVNSQNRQAVLSKYKIPPPHLFGEVEREVYNIMKFDSYPRFLKSDLYVDCLTAERLGKPLPCSCLSVPKSPTGARFRSKSREKNRLHSSKKANSASFGASHGKEVNGTTEDSSLPSKRRSFFTHKKDMDTVWGRLQNRIDDQRGMELNCDMPDFLLQ